MTWLNRDEVDEVVQTTRMYPVANRAARFLKAFVEEVDAHSDGWPYWRLPSNAAKQLMALLGPYKQWHRTPAKTDMTESQLTKALAPIKSFYTRRGYAAGMKLPTT